MVQDLLKDFKDNIIEKSRSPFGGAFIISWCLRNWSLVYTLFNFDTGTNLASKTKFINDYLHTPDRACKLLWLPIIYALCATLAYLILKHLTLAIFMVFDKWVKPFIYEKIDKNEIVDKPTHERLRNSFANMKDERDEAKKELSEVVLENKHLEKENSSLSEENINLVAANSGKTKMEEALEKSEHEKSHLEGRLKYFEDQNKHNYSDNISEVLDGKWAALMITDKGMSTEDFVVRDKYYHVEGIQKYILTDIRINKNNNTIQFKKSGTNSTATSWVYLQKQNESTLVGYESTGAQLIYRRQNN